MQLLHFAFVSSQTDTGWSSLRQRAPATVPHSKLSSIQGWLRKTSPLQTGMRNITRLQAKLQLSFFAAFALAPLAADAADLNRAPPAPSYVPPAAYVETNSWTGFYAGINGGYGWNSGGNSIGYNDGGAGYIQGTDQSGAPQPQGGFGGGQIGYNFQSGSFVFGVETDFQGGKISDRVTGLTVNGNDFTSRESIDWFGTARGRIGYAFGRVLVYGTGGVAYGDVREGAFVTNGVNAVSFGNNSAQIGWVAGGGVEFKITPSWSLRGEYQYINPRQSDAERYRHDRCVGHGHGP